MSKSKAKPHRNTGNLIVNICDGVRQSIAPRVRLLAHVRDGNQKELINGFCPASNSYFKGLPFYDNFDGNYAVVVSADGYIQTGIVGLRRSKPKNRKAHA